MEKGAGSQGNRPCLTLILDFFSSRARTREGKLQVELAQPPVSVEPSGGALDSSGEAWRGYRHQRPGETQIENRPPFDKAPGKKG
jgi:50S ribosomal subunit-associated GTPase HflX